MTKLNRQITLASRPQGYPQVADFQLAYAPVPTPAAGQVLVRSTYLSLDPCMRGRMSEAGSHLPATAIGGVMPGDAVGIVVDSGHSAFRIGDAVEGTLGWQEYAVAAGDDLRKLDPALAPISTALGVLGRPGLAAYFGLLDVCDPREGETVMVSVASGAVGMIVGQIAKLKGCRVIGLAGSGPKAAWLLDELGFDAVWDCTVADDLDGKLQAHCPAGIDIYFDNVGGALTDAVLRHLRSGARVCLCGESSQDNLEIPESAPRCLGQLILHQARVQGFLISRYADRFPEGRRQLMHWWKTGALKYREDVAHGIEAAPQAFIGMLKGRNEGNQLVQLSEL